MHFIAKRFEKTLDSGFRRNDVSRIALQPGYC